MKQKVKIIIYILLPLMTVFNIAHAAGGLVGCTDNCQLGDLVLVVIRLINFLLSLAGFVAMIFIVWAGWNMIQTRGNEEKIATAKATFSDAIIGFFLVLVAFVLVDAIIGILGGFTLKQIFDFIPKSTP